MVKYVTVFLAGMAAMATLHNHTQAQEAPKPTKTETVFIEYQTDVCYSDDIGLKRLTLKDIERIL